MTRFLVDEDLPSSTPDVFARHGYAVTSVRELGLRGATDAQLMERAFENDEIIVTRDTDFGDVFPSAPTDLEGSPHALAR